MYLLVNDFRASERYQMNRKTGIGQLKLGVKEDIRVFVFFLSGVHFLILFSFQIYFHAPEDVPFINSDPEQRKEVLLGEALNISINVGDCTVLSVA